MSGYPDYAWMVTVSDDSVAECALLSGKMIKRTETAAFVCTMVSPSVSKEVIKRLQGIFDTVLVANMNHLERLYEEGWRKEADLLLMSTQTLKQFSKLIVVTAGTVILRQLDHLFDNERLYHSYNKIEIVTVNENKTEWRLAHVVTGSWKRDQRSFSKRQIQNWAHMFTEYETGNDISKYCKDVDSVVNVDKYYDEGIAYVTLGMAKKYLNIMEANVLKDYRPCLPIKDIVSDDVNKRNWIAIVGMSCRFPGANSPDEYWEILKNGRNTSSVPPPHRLSQTNLDPNVKANFLKSPIDQFDASFFGISPSEARITDPQTRLLLEVSWESLEDAGINPEDLKGVKAGVFYGSWVQDYKEAINGSQWGAENRNHIRSYVGNGFGSAASKLSLFYGLTGPNVSTESACSSSIVAVDMAAKSLVRRECPIALACGANLFLQTNPLAKLVSEDGLSKAFDSSADGYGRAEGIAVLVLKRLTDTKRDHDKIYGIIRGSGTSQDGNSTSFGTPSVESELYTMQHALMSANLKPFQVDYVEAHASGTYIGDTVEAAAIVKAYSQGTRKIPLWIGSAKTNIGHTESCSGMAGIIKVLLAMKYEIIPQHIGVNKINPQVNFDAIPGAIALESVAWPRSAQRSRVAGVSSFGLTGTQVHMIIQEASSEDRVGETLSNSGKSIWPENQLLSLSAKSPAALAELTNLFRTFLATSEDTLEAITCTANIHRPHHTFRKAIIGTTKNEMVEKIERGNYVLSPFDKISHKHNLGSTPSVCFLFPGSISGSNRDAFLKLYNCNTFFRTQIEYCLDVCQRVTGYSTSITSFFCYLEESESMSEMDVQVHFCRHISLHYSLAKLWEHWGVKPTAVMGHCLGEFVAAIVSGIMNLEDAFKISKVMTFLLECQRNQMMSALAIKCNKDAVDEHIENFSNAVDQAEYFECSWVDVSCVNSDNQTVVTGSRYAIAIFKQFLEKHNLYCKILPSVQSSFGVHSRNVEPARVKAIALLDKVVHHTQRIPYISSVTGKQVTNAELNGEFWFSVFRNCVYFKQACITAQRDILADVYLEIGLGQLLTKFAKANLADQTKPEALCVTAISESGVLSTVADLYTFGVNFNWKAIHQRSEHRGYPRVKLPNYPFQRKSFWFEQTPQKHISVRIHKPAVHPLLGEEMDAPANAENVCFFQNDSLYKLEDNRVRFIQDHVIGTKIIFPAAAYIEMILSAWKHSTKNTLDNRHVTITNFTINVPLFLDEAKSERIQTVVSRETQTVSVFSSTSGLPWKLHAEAKMGRNESVSSDFSHLKEEFNLSSETADQFYTSLSQIGLVFRNEFRSIKCKFNNVSGDTLIEASTMERLDNFICHPILIDVMLQACIFHRKLHLENLIVPIKINKFTVFPHETDSIKGVKWYVYCKNQGSVITLLNHKFCTVAVMEQPKFAATTKETVLCAAGCSIPNTCIPLYSDTWKPATFYQPSSYLQTNESANIESSLSLSKLKDSLTAMNTLSYEEANLNEIVDRLCYLYIVKAIYDLGWEPGNNLVDKCKWSEESLLKLPVTAAMFRPFKQYLTYLKDRETVPSFSQVETEILTTRDHPLARSYPATEIVHICGFSLAKILKGIVGTHELLFDERRLAEKYYQVSQFSKILTPLEEIFLSLVSDGSSDRCFRILEIGGGTGAFTSIIVRRLTELAIKFEYHFTDISHTLVGKASKLFSARVNEMFVYKTLNIELDPLKQNFPPDYFDVVVAFDVLHATRDLKETLCNVSMLTRVGGSVLIGETEKSIRETEVCFGTFEGYWRFNDDVRTNHCTVAADTWLELLSAVGFTSNHCKVLCCGGKKSVISAQKVGFLQSTPSVTPTQNTWIVLNIKGDQNDEIKLHLEARTNRRVVNLDVAHLEGDKLNDFLRLHLGKHKETLEGILIWLIDTQVPDVVNFQPNSRKILEPLLYLSKYLLKLDSLPRVVLVTEGSWQMLETETVNEQGPASAQAWGFMRNLRLELPKLRQISLDFDFGTPLLNQIDQLLTNMWLDHTHGEVEIKYVQGSRCVRRLNEIERKTSNLVLPKGQFQVELPASGNIENIKFVAKSVVKEELVGEHQVKVDIRCVALNFRDIFCIITPNKEFTGAPIGTDFSGVVTAVGTLVTKCKVGDAVFGADMKYGCMKSQLIVDEGVIIPIPSSMTFSEAASLPVVFFTAWHCMVNVARLQKGQTILVHAISGGVGLAAIQIAMILGIKILGTAGSERKRNFVKRLGVEHVFNSRSLEFKEQIRKVTKGAGVDMVLNCLTGPGFKEATLDVCMDGGHFVEISKLDIWTKDEVKRRRPLVKYDIVDLLTSDSSNLSNLTDTLSHLVHQWKIAPIHHTTFAANQLGNALRYLSKARQIGKVVVNFPRDYLGERKQLLFNERSTYLITGGMGGVGFAVCKWMITQGARYVVLVGRSEPNDAVKEEISVLNRDYQAEIICRQVDISDFKICHNFITKELVNMSFPPLRGIHHCALVLCDKLIQHQDWENFEKVLKPRVFGAWNLHQVTLGLQLEFFVLHSSAATIFGSVRQSNYVSANAYLDSFAQFRRYCDLTVMSVSWGAWRAGRAKDIKFDWATHFDIEDGLAALELLMRENPQKTNVIAGKFDFSFFTNKIPHSANWVENISTCQLSKEHLLAFKSVEKSKKASIISAEKLFVKYKEAEIPNEKYNLVEKSVLAIICETMGTMEEDISVDVRLSELGMDSLMFIELANKINKLVHGIRISNKQVCSEKMKPIDINVNEHGTLSQLSRYVATILDEPV